MYYLTDFMHFITIFSLIFYPIDPIFHWFYIFLTPHFKKILYPIGSNFLSCAESGYRNHGEVPPPPTGVYCSVTVHGDRTFNTKINLTGQSESGAALGQIMRIVILYENPACGNNGVIRKTGHSAAKNSARLAPTLYRYTQSFDSVVKLDI